jgi:uncharacterized protein
MSAAVDDPEFFRTPPPEGRSRESRIVLDVHGHFWDHGERFTHRGLEQAMHRWIGRHPDDGRYMLCNGFDWSYFTVEGTPYFVRSFCPIASGPTTFAFQMVLSDGTTEPFIASNIWEQGDHLFAMVKQSQGRHEVARFDRAAQLALAPYIDVDGETGAFGFRANRATDVIPFRPAPP